MGFVIVSHFLIGNNVGKCPSKPVVFFSFIFFLNSRLWIPKQITFRRNYSHHSFFSAFVSVFYGRLFDNSWIMNLNSGQLRRETGFCFDPPPPKTIFITEFTEFLKKIKFLIIGSIKPVSRESKFPSVHIPSSGPLYGLWFGSSSYDKEIKKSYRVFTGFF